MRDSLEVGVRTTAIPNLTSTISLWYLQLDSELLFVGDAGTTEPSRKSERWGLEFANFYKLNDWLTLDADVAYTDSQFIGGSGDYIPGAIKLVVSAGATVECPCGVFASLRLRYFGERPLIEDNSVDSNDTMLLNFKIGYRYEKLQIALDVLNVLDSMDHDIDYFYTSRLRGEAAGGVDDIHFHPVEPITVRVTLTWLFG